MRQKKATCILMGSLRQDSTVRTQTHFKTTNYGESGVKETVKMTQGAPPGLAPLSSGPHQVAQACWPVAWAAAPACPTAGVSCPLPGRQDLSVGAAGVQVAEPVVAVNAGGTVVAVDGHRNRC